MRILYFGSPDISARLLDGLIATPHEICGVVTNPDRPRGRSGQPVPTEVAVRAMASDIPVFRFESLKGSNGHEAFAELAPLQADLGVVFAYGSIIPERIFSSPRLGSINLHGSLLPALRGASPVQSAILTGLSQTGWTLQCLAIRMDAGDILCTAPIAIDPEETSGELFDRMMPIGIDLVLDSLSEIEILIEHAIRQDEAAATYCSKIRQADTWIDWTLDRVTIHNLIRGMNPTPQARTRLEGQTAPLLIHRSNFNIEGSVLEDLPDGPIGSVCIRKTQGKKRLLARTGSGFLEITELQLSGRRQMKAHDFLNGGLLSDGSCFDRIPGSNEIL